MPGTPQAEVCDGTSTLCPADAFLPPTTICRVATGGCDVAETCTGSSGSCPADALRGAAVVCRPAIGQCDTAEACNGTGVNCPADGFLPAGTSCRASAGVCDVAENCTGSGSACPPDSKRTSVCRPAAGECDLAESCDGTNVACPADAFVPATTTCRAAVSACDVAEFCPGSGVSCPFDSGFPDTDDDAVCDAQDNCDATSNPDQDDTDGDGIGDACDICSNASSLRTARTRLQLSRLLAPAGDDRLSYRGELVVPAVPALDPIANGVRVVVLDAGDTPLIDAFLPGLPYDHRSRVGWTLNGSHTSFRYDNKGLDTAHPIVAGIVKCTLRVSPNSPGQVRFAISGRKGSYMVAANRLPLRAVLVVEGALGTHGPCGDSLFPGPSAPVPTCAVAVDGSSVDCR